MAFISENQLLKFEKSVKREKVLKQEILMFQQVVEALRLGLSQENLFKLILRSVTKGLSFKRSGIFLLNFFIGCLAGDPFSVSLTCRSNVYFEAGYDVPYTKIHCSDPTTA